MQIGEPLRTIIVEPLQSPVAGPLDDDGISPSAATKVEPETSPGPVRVHR